MGCLGLGSVAPAVTEVPLIATQPPCTGFNHFAGTKPEIEAFLASGTAEAVVAPGTPVILTGDVRNATKIHIRRTSAQGPPIDFTDPPFTSKGLGPFSENRPVDATYELSATNRCGTVVATDPRSELPARAA